MKHYFYILFLLTSFLISSCNKGVDLENRKYKFIDKDKRVYIYTFKKGYKFSYEAYNQNDSINLLGEYDSEDYPTVHLIFYPKVTSIYTDTSKFDVISFDPVKFIVNNDTLTLRHPYLFLANDSIVIKINRDTSWHFQSKTSASFLNEQNVKINGSLYILQ